MKKSNLVLSRRTKPKEGLSGKISVNNKKRFLRGAEVFFKSTEFLVLVLILWKGVLRGILRILEVGRIFYKR